jgi:hypothetical protein
MRLQEAFPKLRVSQVLAWMLPFILIAVAGLLSRLDTRIGRGNPRSAREGRGGPTLLEVASRHPGFAFGFHNVLADAVWLEAVQVSGNRKMARDDYDRLSGLLSTVVRFDPRFVVPYLLGGIVLGDSPDHAGAALDLLAQGEIRFPLEWRFPFYTGYVQYFSLGNPEEGGMALLRAARIPGSPEYFPLLASRMLSEGHRPATALAFLQEMTARETDPRRKVSLEERIRRVIVERDLQSMEMAIAEYTSRIGAPPRMLADLVRSGMLARVPEEPYGGRYLLTPDGGVRSDRAPRERLKVLRNQ